MQPAFTLLLLSMEFVKYKTRSYGKLQHYSLMCFVVRVLDT